MKKTYELTEKGSERIKELRKSVPNLTQDELAKAIGCDRITIRRWERHNVTRVNIEQLDLLVKFFKTTPEYILGETDIRDPDEYFYFALGEYGEDENLTYKRAKEAHTKSFFDLCGFEYSDTDITPGPEEFLPDLTDNGLRHHKLHRKAGRFQDLYLSDGELKQLMDSMSNYVEFECYKILKNRDEA